MKIDTFPLDDLSNVAKESLHIILMQKSFRISFFYLVSKDNLILVIVGMNLITKSNYFFINTNPIQTLIILQQTTFHYSLEKKNIFGISSALTEVIATLSNQIARKNNDFAGTFTPRNF